MSDAPGAADWRFPDETVPFLKALKANNDRSWFADNKGLYEEALKKPAAQFCSIASDELERLTGVAHSARVYRIHRDVRFSKDKTPYNAHLHISFFAKGRQVPAFLFGLEPDRLVLGAGAMGFDKEGLDTYRARAADDDGLAAILAALESDGVRLSEPELKRVPSGWPKDHPNAVNLRRKTLTAWLPEEPPETVTAPGIAKRCAESFARLQPLFDWLAA